MPNENDNQPKENDNQAWEYLKEIGEAERHFNNIQARYRLLASTWLLASFTGIGFVLKKMDTPEEKILFLCLISAGGSIGVIIIWFLDILGYHRLLGAYFLEGLRIELKYRHLPQIRWLMRELGTVGSKARLFYFVCAIAPILACLILLLFHFDPSLVDRMQIVVCWALLCLVFLTWVVTNDPKHKAKYTELEQKRLRKEIVSKQLHVGRSEYRDL